MPGTIVMVDGSKHEFAGQYTTMTRYLRKAQEGEAMGYPEMALSDDGPRITVNPAHVAYILEKKDGKK